MRPNKHPHFPPHHWRGSRRFMIMRFAFIFGGIGILFLAAIGINIYLTLGMPHPEHMHGPPFGPPFGLGFMLPLCGIPLTFILITSLIAGWAYRGIGRPIAEVMSAVDSVAEGNLSVRVRENFPREFGQLARRFNLMTEELERAETQRRNLTTDIAHELRTPLHIIQGNLEGIIDGVYEPTSEHINNTLDETKLLARLVTDLQTLSLAEAGRLPFHPTRFLLDDLIDDILSSFSSQSASLDITLKKEISNPTRAINADYDRLDQVLSNLVSNALRHTPQGGTISLITETIPGGIRILVKDTGSGIPAEDLPFIFDRFWRGDKSRAREGTSHSGLGLAIARQLIHAHHGTIEAQSTAGEGTTFIIDLPE
jgi:two-component system sensor histidine kinase BaeS